MIPGSGRSTGEGIGYPIQYSWASRCGSAGKEPACNAGDLGLIPGLGKIPWRRERLPTPVFRPGEFHGLYSLWVAKSWTQLSFTFTWDFPGGSNGKVSAYNAGDPRSIPGSGRSPGEGNANPLQYSCLENPIDRGVWRATVHVVTESQTRLNN